MHNTHGVQNDKKGTLEEEEVCGGAWGGTLVQFLTFTQEVNVEARSGESKRVIERGRALFEAVT